MKNALCSEPVNSDFRGATPRPLLGFGWAGAAASALPAALVVLALVGVDVVEPALRLVLWIGGAGALDWFVDVFLARHGASLLGEPTFEIVGLTTALVATQIHPHRPGAPALMALIGWALLAPVMNHALYAAGFYDLFPEFDRWWGFPAAFHGHFVLLCVTPFVLWLFAASRWVFLGAAAVTAAHVGYFLTQRASMSASVYMTLDRYQGLATVSMHALTAAVLLTWAIRGRVLHKRLAGGCDSCGYDLRGLGDGATCPECGAEPAAASA